MGTPTTITSANSVLTLVVPQIWPNGFQLQGYAVDDAFSLDEIDRSETQMGVDGRMAAGLVFVEQQMEIHLQADSPSKSYILDWDAAQMAARDLFFVSGSLVLPSTNEAFTLTRGVLKKLQVAPTAKKVLQPMTFTLTWQSVQRSSV